MADCGTQNAAYANIESRFAPARSFRYPDRVKVHRAVITPDISSLKINSRLSFLPPPYKCIILYIRQIGGACKQAFMSLNSFE